MRERNWGSWVRSDTGSKEAVGGREWEGEEERGREGQGERVREGGRKTGVRGDRG